MARRRVAIVGAALADGGRQPDHTPFTLIAQGAQRALADSGLQVSDIDGLAANSTGRLQPIEVAEYLGLRPRWMDSTGVGGSTWEIMAAHAADAIAADHLDVVMLVYGSTSRSDVKKRLRAGNRDFGSRGPAQFEVPFGHSLISKYAMAARRHMHQYGTTVEQLAEFAVSARYNAGFNPAAFERDPITVDDVANSEMVASPFTKLHCCLRTDGGCAVILAAEDRVPDTAKEPVWILGSGQYASHVTMSEWDDMTVSPAAFSGPPAFEQAGVSPADIDTCQVYDSFTYTQMVTMEDLGFATKGEGGHLAEGGRLRVGGELPTNTDGGGLSSCQPGMRGLYLMVEATRQLRGEAGDAQVPGAELACVSGTGGWFCSSGTLILGTD
ncbi:MAG: hypothetical protein JJLCMIEE_03536 [Acidimicrobiales bacterium]|nr:MAG: acetyl-CoA acetyltransferase [Actinomycetota bacterium]MBV6510396.1 hypothetical protein [Acidimicrobiales bacterium]RIK02600.1 MAG: acetyl-CoA acetyltransferase [Acidobacteriota bacterium]